MASITTQHSNVAGGLNPTWTPATPAGDQFGPNTGLQTLQVRNLGAVPIVLTVTAQKNCSQNFNHPLIFSVPAQSTPFVSGPFDSQFYVDNNSNVLWGYSTTVQPAPGAPVPSLKQTSYGLGSGVYRYAVTFVNATGETTGGTEISITTSAGYQGVQLDGIPLGPAGTTARKIYRTLVGGAAGAEKLLATISDNTTTSFVDTIPDSALGAVLPATNTAAVPAPGASAVATAAGSTLGVGTYRYQITFVNASGETVGGVEFTVTTTAANTNVSLTGIPLGPSGTTARKIYRSAVGGAAGSEKLVTTLSDNTTTTYTDSLADASLGVVVPVSNTASVVSVAVIAP